MKLIYVMCVISVLGLGWERAYGEMVDTGVMASDEVTEQRDVRGVNEPLESAEENAQYVETKFPSGAVKSQGMYRKGKRHGRYTEYNEHGVIINSAIYRDGVFVEKVEAVDDPSSEFGQKDTPVRKGAVNEKNEKQARDRDMEKGAGKITEKNREKAMKQKAATTDVKKKPFQYEKKKDSYIKKYPSRLEQKKKKSAGLKDASTKKDVVERYGPEIISEEPSEIVGEGSSGAVEDTRQE